MNSKWKRLMFLIVVIIVVLIIFTIFFPCPTSSQYVFFRIFLSILCMLFSVEIPSQIYVNQVGLRITGAFALFYIVFQLTPKLIDPNDPCNEPFEYTIYLRDSDGNKVENFDGMLKIEVKNKFEPGTSNELESSYLFRGIDFSFKNKEVRVELESKNWLFETRKKFTTTTLIERSTSLVVIPNLKARFSNGFVKDKFEIPNVEIYSEGNLIAKTDSRGWYNISIPVENNKTGMKVSFIKKGYLRREEILYIGSSTIKLSKIGSK
jgi:hypothetical protein